MSTYHQAARAYAEKGLPVFPLKQGTKKPATGNGFKSATTELDQIDKWWAENPHYNVGIATGILVAIDIDPRNGGHDWLLDNPEWLDLLMLGCVANTPQRGVHYLFACGEFTDLACSNNRIAPGVDVKANGGYIAAFPSATEHGKYKFVEPSDIDELPHIDDFPVLPDKLGELIRSIKLDRDFENVVSRETKQKIHCRHDYFLEVARRLRRVGVWPEIVKRCLKDINREMLADPRDDDDSFDGELDRMMNPPGVMPAEDMAWMLNLERGLFGDDSYAWIETMPAVFQDACRYYESICSLFQPELFLGAMIAATSMAIGQTWHSHTQVSSNAYVLGLCPTGCGKEHTRKAIRNLLQAAMFGESCSSGKMSSDSSIYTTLGLSNPHLKLSDEFGLILERCARPNENPHSSRITDALLQLYSCADDSRFTGVEYADEKQRKTIPFPHLSMYGTGTPATFWAAVSRPMFDNGLLPRTVILEGRSEPEERKPVVSPVIPESVIEMFKSCSRVTGSVLDGETNNPRQVMQIDSAARSRLDAFARSSRAKIDDGNPVSLMWVRAGENAHKLAMVHAVWRNPQEPIVEIEDIDFAAGIILQSIERFIDTAKDSYHENASEALIQKVYKIIKRRCESSTNRVTNWCERSYLVRCANLPSRHIDIILETLEQSERIEKDVVGRTTCYRTTNS